jgi:flagellar protein FliO/FliZ
MKFTKKILAVMFLNLCLMQPTFAASASTTSPSLSVFKTIFGLTVVLGVMAALAWFAKRLTGRQGYAQSVARIVGGVSVGSRERVVVVEVGDRWLVVGVAAGQVNAIANLGEEDGVAIQALTDKAAGNMGVTGIQAMPGLLQNGHSFAAWLKKSLNKSDQA